MVLEEAASQPFAPSVLPENSYRCRQDTGSGAHLHPLSEEPGAHCKPVSLGRRPGLALLGPGNCLCGEVSMIFVSAMGFPTPIYLNDSKRQPYH